VKKKSRADELLVRAGHAETKAEASARIMAGEVFVTLPSGGERKVEKPGDVLPEEAVLRVAEPKHPFVSRGGVKLAEGLDRFAIDPRGLVALDVGVSTGGFTDCLLQRGASRVHAIDVGYGQIAWKLREDPRVRLHERTNARQLTREMIGERIDLVVIDVSFIGLEPILAAVTPILDRGGKIVALVKPQFEVEASEVDRDGVVRDEAARARAIARVRAAAEALGLEVQGEISSPIRGADGNVEHLLFLVR
jgi:23S rRNA (cytidine1920-2'-O)/16S rRNA (cytidine1409-2'-O)-methyltransferase